MNRRTLLAALGSLSAAGLSGCTVLGGSAPSEDTVTPAPVPPALSPAATPTSKGVPSCAEAGDGYRSESFPVRDLPTPSDQFDPLGCPAFEWADEIVCAHRADLATEPVALVSDDRAFLRPTVGDTVTVTLVNRSDGVVTLQPGGWSILAHREDWQTLVTGDPGCRRTVPAEGGVHWWEIGIGREERSAAVDVTAGRADVDEGRHLFAVPATQTDGTHLALAAPFEIRRPGIETNTPLPDNSRTGNYTFYDGESG